MTVLPQPYRQNLGGSASRDQTDVRGRHDAHGHRHLASVLRSAVGPPAPSKHRIRARDRSSESGASKLTVIVSQGARAAEVRAAIGSEMPAGIQVLAIEDGSAVQGELLQTSETYVFLGSCPQCVATVIHSIAGTWPAAESAALAPSPVRRPAVDREHFSPREQEIMDLLAAGTTVAQIAGRLFLAERTVRNTLTRAYQKLGVRRQSMAVVARLELCR